jgi:serine/threonine protein phosphatase PrpC
VGNIGDSRAVLGTKDENTGEVTPIQITVDLKPDLPSRFAYMLHAHDLSFHLKFSFFNRKAKCND